MKKSNAAIVCAVFGTIFFIVAVSSVLSNLDLWGMAFSIFSILVFMVPTIAFFVFLSKFIKRRQEYMKDNKNDYKPNVIRPKKQASPIKSFINITGDRLVTCSTCGNKVDYNNSNCPRCNEPLKVICRCCGNENRVYGPACPDCGKDLTSK